MPHTPALQNPRPVERLVQGRATRDGDGVKLTRVLTGDLQRRLDPFLMLDAFGSDEAADYVGGFPDHPHRGFETVTYMLAGRMRHRDSAGHEGLLSNGGVQWMTAGRGVIHSEMPEQEAGRMEGFQLWLNLPARDKMVPAWYRDIPSEQIPEAHARAAPPCGSLPAASATPPAPCNATRPSRSTCDIHLDAGTTLDLPVPEGHNAFVYVYRGNTQVAGTPVARQHMAVLASRPGHDGVRVQADPAMPARLLLIAGRPLGEPIAQYGPFVMNTQQELVQAVDDYRAGRLA